MINEVRYVNSVILGSINLYLLISIINSKQQTSKSVTLPLLLLLMPLNFTFMFLFYTETLSLTVILWLYKRIIYDTNSNSFINVLIGIFALLTR